jgi:hypothetical protein
MLAKQFRPENKIILRENTATRDSHLFEAEPTPDRRNLEGDGRPAQ